MKAGAKYADRAGALRRGTALQVKGMDYEVIFAGLSGRDMFSRVRISPVRPFYPPLRARSARRITSNSLDVHRGSL